MQFLILVLWVTYSDRKEKQQTNTLPCRVPFISVTAHPSVSPTDSGEGRKEWTTNPTNTHVSPLHFTFRFRLSLFYASFFSSFVPLFIHNQTPKPGFEFDYLVFCICNNCVYWIILMYFPFSEVIISHCD